MACDTVTLMLNSDSAVTGVRSVIQCFGTSGFYEAVRTWYWNQFDREYLPCPPIPSWSSANLCWVQRFRECLSFLDELTLKSYRTSLHININPNNDHHANENH
jgi:hypothetical protein